MMQLSEIKYTYFFNVSQRLVVIGLADRDFIKHKGLVEYSVKPDFKVDIDYDLGMYHRLYERYSLWGKEKKCVVSREIFEDGEVGCTENGEFLNFEVITKDLGYAKPKIIFKIRKTGELFDK